ncbi:MAG: iron-sulfur cluster assembly scaffold protein, partial [Tepidiformaceae bacterium]
MKRAKSTCSSMRWTKRERCLRVTVREPRFDELFREVILDHYRRPRNRGVLAGATQHAEGLNPVCGDEIR